MKISKLFHWLYALIMFLPVFFWIPTAFYYGFNEHATNPSTTDVQINYKYQSNEINSLDDLVVGNIYTIEYMPLADDNIQTGFSSMTLYFLEIEELEYDGCNVVDWSVYDYNYLDFNSYILFDGSSCTITIETSSTNITIDMFDVSSYLFVHNMTFMVKSQRSMDNFKIWYNNNINYDSPLTLPQYTDYNFIDSVDVIENGGISNAMNQSWQDVWSLPMFSWTHDTFFSAPFNYIAGLFGIQSGNTLSYCLSYWFSISIIWLVFDLMIYVPLLVHRWLDKAGIQ